MNEIQLIKNMIGEVIAPYGFVDEGLENKKGVIFTRKRKDLKQHIFVQLVAKNHLRLEFSTNAYQQRHILGNELLPGKRPVNWSSSIPGLPLPDDWWEWNDESEFKSILNKFKDIILKYGLHALEEISTPAVEFRPSIQCQWKLYRNHSTLNIEYRKILGVEQETSGMEVIETIHKAVLKIRNQDFNKIEEYLTGLAAVYGDAMIMMHGGEWKWRDDFNNVCWISGMNGRKYFPLYELTSYWASAKNEGNSQNH